MKATVAGIRRTLYGMFAANAVGGARVAALVGPVSGDRGARSVRGQ